MKGQCLCGGICYEVDKIEQQMGHCHCRMCRKFHGAAFSTYAEAKRDDFRWVKGKDLLVAYVAENGSTRQFCKVCGSSLTFAESGSTGDVVEFALGTLDSDIAERPDMHIYTDFKANWHEIEDCLPCHKNGRESELR